MDSSKDLLWSSIRDGDKWHKYNKLCILLRFWIDEGPFALVRLLPPVDSEYI